MTHIVKVSGLSPSITQDRLADFFSFCGEVETVHLRRNGDISADVVFRQPEAVKTALVLSGTTLDDCSITVSSSSPFHENIESKRSVEGDAIEQHEKPRAAIAAEYLARGYSLSENVLNRAIQTDKEHGISTKFLSYMKSLDASIGAKALGPEQSISGKVQETYKSATVQARTMDEQKGISKTANDYYVKMLSSPFGQKVRDFYTDTSKQIHDIHEEALRLKRDAELQKSKTT